MSADPFAGRKTSVEKLSSYSQNHEGDSIDQQTNLVFQSYKTEKYWLLYAFFSSNIQKPGFLITHLPFN